MKTTRTLVALVIAGLAAQANARSEECHTTTVK